MSGLEWRNFIHCDEKVLLGKPVVKGTRLSVDFVLGLFAEGWSKQQVLESYPTLTDDSLKAIFSFASETLQEESFYNI